MTTTPRSFKGVGVSPRKIAAPIRVKRGVKEDIGAIRETGDKRRALYAQSSATVSSKPEKNMVIKNFGKTCGNPCQTTKANINASVKRLVTNKNDCGLTFLKDLLIIRKEIEIHPAKNKAIQ